MRLRVVCSTLFALVGSMLLVDAAFAHAFGTEYTLPLPVEFYFIGAGSALLASFAILALFSDPATYRSHAKEGVILWSNTRPLELTLPFIGVAVFSLTILFAFAGSPSPAENPTLILFWLGLLLGMTYMSALVGGLWECLNPFRRVVKWILGTKGDPLATYPSWMGYTPALVVYFLILWLELLSFGLGAIPEVLGLVLLLYLVVSFVGSLVFGTDTWFTYGDFFSVFFRIVSYFAPLQLSEGSLKTNVLGSRMVHEQATHITLLIFILLMLASTAFDALHETQIWVSFFYQGVFQQYYAGVLHVMLLLSPLVFLLFYMTAIVLTKMLVATKHSLLNLSLRFAYSLVPIVVVYHFAHFMPLLLFEGQNIIPMLSDPFLQGWNLFGTIGYQYDINLIGAKFIWYLQVVPIIVGHIIATYIAHRIALEEYHSRIAVIVSQIPMLLLMLFYTIFGLWVLSLPFGAPVY